MSSNSGFEQTTYAGQVVVVTGAASGIGKSAAQLIASRGATVICVDLNQAGANQCADEINKTGAKAEGATLDISNQSAVMSLISEIEKKHNKIDALVNCAGYPGPTGVLVETINWSDFQKVIEVNLYGAIWLTQAVLPGMKKQKAKIEDYLPFMRGKQNKTFKFGKLRF